jgi:hypothetical protein
MLGKERKVFVIEYNLQIERISQSDYQKPGEHGLPAAVQTVYRHRLTEWATIGT